MTTTLLNLTPHELNIRMMNGEWVKLAPSGTVARVSVKSVPAGDVNGIALTKTEMGEIVDLPAPAENVMLITSLVVAAAAKRPDVVSPGQLIRDDRTGQPIGADGLALHI